MNCCRGNCGKRWATSNQISWTETLKGIFRKSPQGQLLPNSVPICRSLVTTDSHYDKVIIVNSRGVVQLFNAVRKQQKSLDDKLKELGTSESKRQKVVQSMSKGRFLDMLKGDSSGNGPMNVTAEGAATSAPKVGCTWDAMNRDASFLEIPGISDVQIFQKSCLKLLHFLVLLQYFLGENSERSAVFFSQCFDSCPCTACRHWWILVPLSTSETTVTTVLWVTF